jgi:hypothetical protein
MSEEAVDARPQSVTGRQSRWRYAERLKTVLEILAILVAGLWAYTRFTEGEAPSLVKRADMTGSVTWYAYSSGECHAEYEVEFHNIGKIPIDIRKARLGLWYLTETTQRDLLGVEKVKLLSPMDMRESPALLEIETARLTGKYAPDEKAKEGFSFVVKRAPGRRLLFAVALWDADSGAVGVKPTWDDWRWSWVCDKPASASKSVGTR